MDDPVKSGKREPRKQSRKESSKMSGSHHDSAQKLKESEDFGDEDNSRLDLVPEDIRMHDLLIKVKSRDNKSGSEHAIASPDFNDSKDGNSTTKDNDITAIMRKKVFECPDVVVDDHSNMNIQNTLKKIDRNTDLSTMRSKKRHVAEGFDIFKKFMHQASESESFAYRFITHSITQMFFIFFTIYSLFADDYRILASSKSTDGIYDIFTIICFCLFLIEIIVYSMFKDEYIFRYAFWLDVVSTLSLLLDINLISDMLNGNQNKTSGSAIGGVPLIGKISRLLRVVRLVRVSKLYKTLNIVENKSSTKNEHANSSGMSRDSKVGRKMSELATKTVIISCFVLLIMLPLFDTDFYVSDVMSIDPACDSFRVIMMQAESESIRINKPKYDREQVSRSFTATSAPQYLNYFTSQTLDNYELNDNPLIRIDLSSEHTFYQTDTFALKRDEDLLSTTCEYSISAGDASNTVTVGIWQDNSFSIKINAILNIVRTFFVCCIVLGGSMWFGRRIHELMIQPIERMIDRVTLLIRKPQKIKEQAFIKQEEDLLKGIVLENDEDDDEFDGKKKKEELETVRIESAINKIGILLGVGFGDAGTNLINLYLSKEGEGDLLIPGSEIEAIFGFCDIRKFTDVTEVLQEEVMVFVNSIAEIVHSITDKYLGAANKNIGDAFLLVWKSPKQISDYLNATKTNQHNVMSCLADLAFIAFLKIFCEINKAFNLVKYINDERIKSRVDIDFKVRMGFGLHYGWAIEGAIGSYFKVDVSYLSPNVNMAARLEAATKQYGVPILLSGEFYDLMSMSLKDVCRKVDIVTVKGSEQPLRLYSPDISDRALIYPTKPRLLTNPQITKECYAFKKLLIGQILNGVNVGPPLFANDNEISVLLCYNDPKFKQFFNTAIEAYERGEWRMAKDFIERCLALQPEDGPSQNIHSYMSSLDFKKPEYWTGVRKLTEK